jgi:hypothetical protein
MWVIAALATLGIGAAGSITWGRWSNRTTPITVDELVTREAAAASTSTVAATAPDTAPDTPPDTTPDAERPVTTGPSSVPDEGVYPYRTTGSEHLDLLTGVERRYPSETGIVVSHTACGFDLSWHPYVERSYTVEICRRNGDLVLVGYTNRYEFFGRSEQRHVVCEPAPRWLAADGFTTTCAGDGVVERRTASAASESVAIDGRTVAALHVVIDTSTSGTTEGATHEELWLDRATGLVLRLDRTVRNETSTAVGNAVYDEHVELMVSVLTPVG